MSCLECKGSNLAEEELAGQHLLVCHDCGSVKSVDDLVDDRREFVQYYNETHTRKKEVTRSKLFYEMVSLAEKNAVNLILDRTTKEMINSLIEKVYDENLYKKAKNKETLAIACVYIVCRQNGMSVTLRDVSGTSGIDIKSIYRAVSIIKKQFNITIYSITVPEVTARFLDSSTLDKEICSSTIGLMKLCERAWLVTGKNHIEIFVALTAYEAWRAHNRRDALKEDSFDSFIRKYSPNFVVRLRERTVQNYKRTIRFLLLKLIKKLKPGQKISEKQLFLHTLDVIKYQTTLLRDLRDEKPVIKQEKVCSDEENVEEDSDEELPTLNDLQELEEYLERRRIKRLEKRKETMKQRREFKSENIGIVPLCSFKRRKVSSSKKIEETEIKEEMSDHEIDSYVT